MEPASCKEPMEPGSCIGPWRVKWAGEGGRSKLDIELAETLEVTTWGTSPLADQVLKTTAGALILTFKLNVWPMSGMSLNLNYFT